MAINIISKIFVVTGLCLCFTLDAIEASENSNSGCRGPTNYYKELGCTRVFKNPYDRCPVRYNCSALKKLRNDQCLVSGHVYESDQRIRAEDANPCDWCTCSGGGSDRPAGFACAAPRCPAPTLPNKSCHFVVTNKCCGSQIVCPKPDGTYHTCIVDGKTYRDGEAFVPVADPEKRCRCKANTGKNVEPYCISPKHTWCNNVIRSQTEIRTCAPVYPKTTSLATGCNEGFRCPSHTDVVIKSTKKDETKNSEHPDNLCKFGNLVLRINDELNEDPSKKVKCVCEVPPILTCRQTIAN